MAEGEIAPAVPDVSMVAPGTMLTGIVKAWIDERGMGFISPDTGGDDVFVHRSNLLDGQMLQVGSHVSFVDDWDPAKNKRICREVAGAVTHPGKGGGLVPTRPPAAKATVVAPGSLAGTAPATWTPVSKVPPAAPAAGQLSGTVKAWIEARGMGFISPDTGGEDVFVHRSNIQDGQILEIGARVTFQDDWDIQKNKRIAQNVYGGTMLAAGKGAAGYQGQESTDGFVGVQGGQGGAPSANCWVGDLPPETDQAQLATLFEAYGVVVNCKLLPPRQAGEKACGLVRFSSEAEARWVVDNLNGNIPQGLDTPIIVRFANNPGGPTGNSWQPPPPAGPPPEGHGRSAPYAAATNGGVAKGKADGSKGGKPSPVGAIRTLFGEVRAAGILGGGKTPDECQVYVKNLPVDATDLDLYKLFAPFGAIAPTGVKAMVNPDGTCKGIGFVDFADAQSATLAVSSLNGFTCSDGGILIVAHKRPGKGGVNEVPTAPVAAVE